MKTSNKLLLGLLALCLIVTISIMSIIRSHAEPNLNRSNQKEGDQKYTINFNSPVEANTFDLGHNNSYFLDSDKVGITIVGPEYAVQSIRKSGGETLKFIYESRQNKADQEDLTITIGTKDVDLKTLIIRGNAACKGDRRMTSISSIAVSGNAKLHKISVNSPQLDINCNGNSKATITADVEQLNATSNGNSDIYFKNESNIKSLNVDINGNGNIDADKADYVSGRVSGNGNLDVDDVANQGNVITSGNGKDYSRYH